MLLFSFSIVVLELLTSVLIFYFQYSYTRITDNICVIVLVIDNNIMENVK